MATVSKDPRNNHYLVRWRDPSGKQCKKSFTRKADAERWRANVVTGMSTGLYLDPQRGKQTLGEFADVWLSHQTQLKPSTFNRYQGIVVTHIKPVWGGYQLGKIATNEVNAWIITETPEARNIFGQSTSSFTFEQVLKENKVLLVNLSGIAGDTAALVGTIFMQGLWTAVQDARGSNKPAYLYLDEFQSFLRLPVAPEEMLTKARSYKLGMRLAHQHIDQLASYPELKSAIMANTFNKVIFQLGAEDSMRMAREFGSLLTANDFQMLRQYEAYARVVTSEGTSQPFSLRTNPPARPTNYASDIITRSRAKYGRPVDEVIKDMRERRNSDTTKSTRRRPTISGEDWAN